MKPQRVEVTGIWYKRPGLNRIGFIAIYKNYRRRGTVVYDTTNQYFLTHTGDVEFLLAVCTSLQQLKYNRIR